MNKDDLRTPDYLDHILEAADRILLYTKDMDAAGFLNSSLVQDAVVRNLEIVGEAARNVKFHDPGFAAEHADIPWDDMYLMRNRVAHGYFSVDLSLVWNTLQRDIPELSDQIRQLKVRLQK